MVAFKRKHYPLLWRFLVQWPLKENTIHFFLVACLWRITIITMTKMSQVQWQLLYLLANNPNQGFHLFLCSPAQSLAMWGLSWKPILYYSSNSNTLTHAYSFNFRTRVKTISKRLAAMPATLEILLPPHKSLNL